TGQAKRPGRPDLDALLDRTHPSAPATLVAAAEQVHVEQQRAAADDLHELAGAGAASAPAAREPAAGATARGELRRAALVAREQADNGGACDETAGSHGGGLNGRQRGGRGRRGDLAGDDLGTHDARLLR